MSGSSKLPFENSLVDLIVLKMREPSSVSVGSKTNRDIIPQQPRSVSDKRELQSK